jgi:hypothetical protein
MYANDPLQAPRSPPVLTSPNRLNVRNGSVAGLLPRLSGADAILDPLASSLSAFPRYQNEHCSTGSVWCTVRVRGGVLECAGVAHE